MAQRTPRSPRSSRSSRRDPRSPRGAGGLRGAGSPRSSGSRRGAEEPRAATLNDVAREAGVSVATVSRVVNGQSNVTPETRERIAEVVAQLRYIPHSAARSLITKRTHVIGVLLPDIYGGFFSELIRGIDAAAREQQLQVLLSSSHGDAEQMRSAMRAMRGRVEGLLILAPQVDARGLGELDPVTPIVFMNSRVEGGTSSSLAIDSYQGARAMVRHLASCGHRDIAHVAGPADNYDAQERERGYRDEIAASLSRARPYVIRGDFTEASGYGAGRALGAESRRPSAVFAANDGMALGCLAAFDELGLRVPDDIAVTGFDDIPQAAFVRPALTTVRVRIAELGRCAVSQLAEAIAHPEAARAITTMLRPDLVVRESCGAARARSSFSHRQPVNDGGHDGTDPRLESRGTSDRSRRSSLRLAPQPKPPKPPRPQPSRPSRKQPPSRSRKR
ncbi:MAG TPA: LacI family DNA-binding transcriptional regulator [Kofleriaceae bacterium]|nr:LacI family DNA-binding transcriptional regulator [Kofleriaceae bacterium]